MDISFPTFCFLKNFSGFLEIDDRTVVLDLKIKFHRLFDENFRLRGILGTGCAWQYCAIRNMLAMDALRREYIPKIFLILLGSVLCIAHFTPGALCRACYLVTGYFRLDDPQPHLGSFIQSDQILIKSIVQNWPERNKSFYNP